VTGGIRDANGNFAAFNATAPTDQAPPVLTGMWMLDNNHNGLVDQVEMRLSENIANVNVTQWTLKNVPSGGLLTGASAFGNVVWLNLKEGTGPPDTSVGKFTVALAAASTGVQDAAGNLASFAATAPTDAAAPALTNLSMFDSTGAGFVNRVVATFSETLANVGSGTAALSQWQLANPPSGQTVSSVAISGNQANLTLTPTGGAAPNTAAGAFTIALGAFKQGLQDAAANTASFKATAPQDKAGPAVVSMSSHSAGASGLLMTGSTLSVTFSEPVTGIAKTVTITETDGGSKADDTLSISGVTNGVLDMGSKNYVVSSKAGTVVTFSATVMLSNGNTTVTVTAGSCSASCANVAAAAGPFTYRPASSITDGVSNPADGAVTLNPFAIF
jgi:hypothetical protein